MSFRDGVYWNDAIHWVNDVSGPALHFKLDILNEPLVLTTLKAPSTLDWMDYRDYKLFNSRGCFLLLCRGKFECSERVYNPSIKLYVYEMRSECSEWSVKYIVNLAVPLPKRWSVSSNVGCIFLGEREADSFIVIKLSEKVVQYKIVSKTLRTLANFGAESHFDSCFEYIASFANVVDGLDVLKAIEKGGSSSGATLNPDVIMDCGQLSWELVLYLEEATVKEIQTAFIHHKLTSKKLVHFYINQIEKLNPIYKAVIEINPDAVAQAEKADQERKANSAKSRLGLHGIPVMIKDNIATKDKLNTTAGSYALLDSIVSRDAGVVKKLRESGAIILGKASLSEWAHYRSSLAPSGWNARTKQAVNPYLAKMDPCGSSTGSAISVATNMVTVSLGTETDGSILCPSNANSVVGIKPTVGLTSRSGVIPISPRQDTVGPICRTVTDAVYVLDAIVGFDEYDAEATQNAFKYIPEDGYLKHLNSHGLEGKRLGVMRAYPYFGFGNDTTTLNKFEKHFAILRQGGATLIENLEINNFDHIVSLFKGESLALSAEFKIALNDYLKELVDSPVRSLADVITFNNKFANLELLEQYPQDLFLAAEKTNGIGKLEEEALMNLKKASKDGFEKLMKENKLDALVTPYSDGSTVLAIGGYPGISVPAGYDKNGGPYGICFGGLKGSEPTLIEIAYGFEQATKLRKPPPIKE
ncbi:probable amidase [Tanacetum coccineum]